MDYFKAFETIKTVLEKADITPDNGHFAIQVRISDEDAGGIFYIEIRDGRVFAEPYDYYDNNADVLTSVKDFKSIIERKTNVSNAVSNGKIQVSGDIEGFIRFIESIKKKPVKKRTTAKTTVKKNKPEKSKSSAKVGAKTAKTVKKAVKKETEAVKMADDSKKTTAPGKETIESVVEKETKPKKKTK